MVHVGIVWEWLAATLWQMIDAHSHGTRSASCLAGYHTRGDVHG
jgi:hypothetical protein